MIDLYDSEILAAEKVMAVLNRRAEGRQDRDAFDREIHDRFAEIGLKVTTTWYHGADTATGAPVQDLMLPKVTIDGRTDRHEFDHDRMVHEVTRDLLELGEGGVIDTSGGPTPEQRQVIADHAKHQHE